MPSPHPQRCETCNLYWLHNGYSGCKKSGSIWNLSKETIGMINYVGCASHSTLQPKEGHCGHECVCAVLALGGIVGDTTPCDLTQDCIFDTRKQPSAEQRIEKALEKLEAKSTQLKSEAELVENYTYSLEAKGIDYAISILRGEQG